jgi:hypothetical protein
MRGQHPTTFNMYPLPEQPHVEYWLSIDITFPTRLKSGDSVTVD